MKTEEHSRLVETRQSVFYLKEWVNKHPIKAGLELTLSLLWNACDSLHLKAKDLIYSEKMQRVNSSAYRVFN